MSDCSGQQIVILVVAEVCVGLALSKEQHTSSFGEVQSQEFK
jgi:hypothetical protein